jgi:bifunctional DNA-binding transcriptional regulator/antitoxin component of YhaV-PrlF toxin-antitoxin module
VTIPQEIRERFGIFPETDVDFLVEGDRIYLEVVSRERRRRRIEALLDRMSGAGDVPLTTDEIMEMTRGE